MQLSRDAIGRAVVDEIGEGALDGAPATFLGSIVTGVALAVGESEVRYMGASAVLSDDVIGVRVGAFTDGTVATVEAAYSLQSGTANVTTRVHRRGDLDRLEVIGGTPSLGVDDNADWPGRFTVRASYRDGLELTIPMSEANTPQKRSSVWTILSALREDLAKR
ncbi:hypothetical protein LLS1_14670 [Leifsonia sp. LS1]|uniref:hypothetical protein n=1 Tax=unclassified Leifsonia TaxID=2663824 RepID=UPI001CBF58FD|nr:MULTISPECIES: hypothetical protein [unclassified Leifsonia]UAJ78819.1 hypothetical protein IT072_16545 [Leifsonia sp. ZF2019]GIT79798.1 hypothetical protein LLS1_14670 [Leifsonia sp. LS1]